MNHGHTSRGPIEYSVFPSGIPNFTIRFSMHASRERDVLEALLEAGATGCTFFDAPAPRWAASIYRLRKRGIEIETIREPHGGPYPGTHARYFLRCAVTRRLAGGEE